jgi:putative DNA primase/helicase
MNLERRILFGLIASNDYLARIKDHWQDDLCGSPEMRRIPRWCLDYFEKYRRAPGRDIEQIFLAAVRDEAIPKAEAELIEDLLKLVADDHPDDWKADASELSIDFLLNETVAWFRERRMEHHIASLQDLQERGRLDEAEALAAGFRPVVPDADDSLATTTIRPVAWLWPGRIARGKLTLIVGRPDLGKSTLLCDSAARISSGGQWPDGARVRKRAVLIASAEDDYADTVVPRLVAAGADLSMCYEIGRDAADIGALCREVERKIAALRDKNQIVSAVTIDPLSSYLGGRVDAHNEAGVRVALRPLQDLASRHRVAVIALRHLRKAGSGPAVDQISGSLAFVAAARAAYLISRADDDETKCLFLHLKNNLAPAAGGLAYRLVGSEVPVRTNHGTEMTEVVKLHWLNEEISISADDALTTSARGRQPKMEKVSNWLTDILRDGPLSARKIERLADEAGYSMRTVQRAASDLGIEKDKAGFQGEWRWKMPTTH